MESADSYEPFRRTLASGDGSLSWNEHCDQANLVDPSILMWDMDVYYDEGYSSRIETCRSVEVVDRWLVDIMATSGFGDDCHVYPCAGPSWWQLSTAWSQHLLVSIWRSKRPPPHVLLLSGPGDRALLVTEREQWIYGTIRAVSEADSRTQSRARLAEAVSRVPGSVLVPRGQVREPFAEDRVWEQTPFATLKRRSPSARRRRWLGDCLRRFRSIHGEPDILPAQAGNDHGPYWLSFGASGPIPWTQVWWQSEEEWLDALWQTGATDRFLVMSWDQQLVLGVRTIAERYEGYLWSAGRRKAP